MAALRGDVTSILPTERIAPKVQTLFPFDVPTFQDDDTLVNKFKGGCSSGRLSRTYSIVTLNNSENFLATS